MRARSGRAFVELPPQSEHRLANGLRVVVVPRRELPLVTARLIVEAGAAGDPPARKGLAYLTGHLLGRGSERRGADEIHEAIEREGASLDVGVGADATVVASSAPSEGLGKVLEILAEVVTRPAFERKEFNALKRRTSAELAQGQDDPSLVAERLLLGSALAPQHPYALPATGTLHTLASIQHRDVIRHHQRAFSPERALLFVVGDVEVERVLRLVRRHFGPWRGAGAPAAAAEETGEAPSLRIVSKPEATQVQVGLAAGIALRKTDPDFFPALVANCALGGGFTSRIVDAIRVERGLSYSASTRLTFLRRGAFFAFRSFTKNESVGELLQVALGEIERVREEGFEAEEIERAKRYLAGLQPLRYETNEQIAAAIAEIHLFDLPEDWIAAYRERLEAVGPAEAHEAARRFFLPAGFGAVLVGAKDAIRRGLRDAGLSQRPVEIPSEWI